LLGTWQLSHSYETLNGNIVNTKPLGEKPTGFIHYLDDNRMAALIAQDGRKPISNNTRRNGSEAELAEMARTFDAYAGPYTIRDENTVVHHLEISSFQNDLGADYVRGVKLENGELSLSPPDVETPEGVRGMVLVWRRLS
jgi:hypothetical protein